MRLGFFNFQGVTIHPACLAVTTGPFFELQVQFLITSVLLILCALGCLQPSGPLPAAKSFKRGSVVPTTAVSVVDRTEELFDVPGDGEHHTDPSIITVMRAQEGGHLTPLPTRDLTEEIFAVEAKPAEPASRPMPTHTLNTTSDVRLRSCHSCSQQSIGRVRHITFILLQVLYGTISTQALATVWCTAQHMTVRAYLNIIGDGTTLVSQHVDASLDELNACLEDPLSQGCNGKAPLLDRVITASVLSANPSVVCYEGSHVGASILAWLLLCLYSIAFPIASLWLIRSFILRAMTTSRRYQQWTDARTAYETRLTSYLRSYPRALRPCASCFIRICRVRLPRIQNQGANTTPPPQGTTTRKSSWISMFNVHLSDANAVEAEPSAGAISTSASTTSRRQAWSPSGPTMATNLRNNGTEEVDPDGFVDAEVALSRAKQFASFLDADYRASHYYFVHINMLMLLCLLIVANIFKTDASITSAALEMVCIVVIVLILLALNTIHRPYKRGEKLANVVGNFVL
jgi:hypothetical protein